VSLVVVGDIGGHLSVLDEVLDRLGVGDDMVVPDGITVIQDRRSCSSYAAVP